MKPEPVKPSSPTEPTTSLYGESIAERLRQLSHANAVAYRTAEPFPHIVIDDLLPPELLQTAVNDFPGPRDLRWIEYDREHEQKLAFPSAEKLPASLRDLLFFLNSAAVLEFLETLTGISGLLPDPYFVGGGLHQIERGGHLGVHADFNKYERFDLDRRLNLLLYLNQDWPEEFGGHLELWDRTMSQCVKRVLPVFNRCVVFSTTDFSFHGHPVPLNCPPERTRRSVATYYYTNGRPEDEASEVHSTLFQDRPGAEVPRSSLSRTAKRVARSLTPPIVTETYYRLRGPKKK
jgi:Rps23 Pro-64 3,4-dihydroxylase Tpa1-like proline 4-hydroxylase